MLFLFLFLVIYLFFWLAAMGHHRAAKTKKTKAIHDFFKKP